MAKYKAGLYNYRPADLEHLYEDLNGLENDVLYEEAIEGAITVAKNNFALMPIKNWTTRKLPMCILVMILELLFTHR